VDSKTYRLREFTNHADGRSLIVDTSAGLSLGALPGLEDFSGAVRPVLPLVDGIVTSPGQSRKLSGRTRTDAALLVRADWTNALRGPEFVLPPETISRVPLLTPQEALDLGASALVTHFLLGYEEHIEAGCLRTTVQLAIAGSQVGMPLLVDVQPLGPRVALYNKAIELGVSYALEGGADGVVVPWPGRESLQTILTMAAGTPVWLKLAQEEGHSEGATPESLLPAEALELGAAGLWLGAGLFAGPEPLETLQTLRGQIHQSTPVT
jgi:DhnA family fructose-bisphosphate aldolase class Ia